MGSRFEHSRYLVKPGSKVKLAERATANGSQFKDKEQLRSILIEDRQRLADAQSLLWANSKRSILIIFQGMDASGKDGAIKHVMSGVNPQGVDVHSFKAPNEEERLHHFLWRFIVRWPAKGRITIFNRSYYEEVLVVRVHPEFLDLQFIPEKNRKMKKKDFWNARYRAINRWEEAAVLQDTMILKFFLHISKDEQRKRFMKRLKDPGKYWKFSSADIEERQYWDKYQKVYNKALSATSTDHAPWYIIPGDNKWFARALVADIICSRIGELELDHPQVSDQHIARIEEARNRLQNEKGK